ncbi:conserved hypothetical protein [Thermosediminibacter oceani DSM 16646]|uniref:Uncharacterized protein n=2 Tax=Thermosediminibacter TaxID=291988 RepID=D9S3S1_THEOJ|nr:conserved hypothetical protein [Thermosediminibacter oceani DSM 16646]
MDEFAKKIDELIEFLKEHMKRMDKMIDTIEQCLLMLTNHEIRISNLEKTVYK